MATNTYTGYLVIGDISGYTSYVAQTELEHSQAVLTELLELIVGRFQPLLKLVKLEGDAVFAHGLDGQVPRGESLLELIEATYVAFRGRVDGIVRHTTCECKACKAIPTLDLKFMVHHGDYVVQNVSGISELIGSDVNLIHRLTKNHVSEATGWQAYALFTEQSLEHIGVDPDGMYEQVEAYEHLGEVKTFNLDLRERYKEIAEGRHVFITPDEADATLHHSFRLPPPIVWEWLTEPQNRNLFSPNVTWSAVVRPSGRSGVGATNHCAHGKDAVMVETVLDWRPFEYCTVRSRGDIEHETMLDSVSTFHFEPSHDGRKTHLHWSIKADRRRWFMPLLFKIMARQVHKSYNKAEELMLEEMARREELADNPVSADSITRVSETE